MNTFGYCTRTVCLIMALLLPVAHCMAQTGAKGAAPSTDSDAVHRAQNLVRITLIQNDLSDLDRLHSINPLQLTPAELKKLITVLEGIQQRYDSSISAISLDEMNPLYADLKADLKQGLKGKTLSSDLDDKIKKALAVISARRNVMNMQNIADVSKALEDILTKEQIRTAADLEKNVHASNENPNTTRAQWFHLWVGEVLLSYSRIIPLLQSMEAAREPKSSTANAAASGTK